MREEIAIVCDHDMGVIFFVILYNRKATWNPKGYRWSNTNNFRDDESGIELVHIYRGSSLGVTNYMLHGIPKNFKSNKFELLGEGTSERRMRRAFRYLLSSFIK